MESEQEMMARISRLAGQINRHKNQQQASAVSSNLQTYPGSPYPTPNYNSQATRGYGPGRGGYRGRGYYRGGKAPAIHRNKTLVLNNASSSSKTEVTQYGDTTETATPPAPAWVSKTDRHMQLINPAIYEKQSQERARAIEETRKLKLKEKDEREKFKLSKHLQRLDGAASSATSPNIRSTQNYEIEIQGMRFRVMKDGSKLVKVDGDQKSAKMTPKSATVGGVRFYRSKNGNLYRSGIVKAQRRTGAIKKIDEPCRVFSTTGICPKGPRCRYIHDASKVAICKEFLLKGSCTAGDSCDLSHDLTPERTPACLHFAKGNCSNEKCRYSHVRVSPGAPVCRAFAIYGYCEKGAACAERHVHECPDFSNTGACNTKGCKLPHRLKASTLRRNAARGDEVAEEESSDVSSEDEAEEIDSDDVDSDDLEFLGQEDGAEDVDIPMQQDYVQL